MQERQKMDQEEAGEEISISELIATLIKWKKKLVVTTLIGGGLGLAYSLFLPNIYTATTTFLPPQGQQSSASAILSQLGGLGGAAGGALGLKSPGDLYVGMLKSRTVQDDLVQQFKLTDYFKTEFLSVARKGLEGASQIASGKDGLVTVSVDHKDPGVAADLANAYIVSLKKLLGKVAVTEASQRRLFFERQLGEVNEKLSLAEMAAKKGMGKAGVASLEAQGRSLIETAARLRGLIAAQEVKLGAMQGYAAAGNPELIKAQQELGSMRNELAKIEGVRQSSSNGKDDQAAINNVKLLRDIKYYEALYEALSKQLEIARLDEAKEGAVIQVVDQAVTPDRKSKPKRAIITVVSTLAGLFLGVLLAFWAEFRSRRLAAKAS